MMLRWYQQEAVAATWDFLCRNTGRNPIVVLPTGSGKSHVIAQLAQDAVKQWQGRVIVLAHRKELLEQNAAKLGGDIQVGIYSAGLRSRDVEQPIIMAGIQSAYDKAHLFGVRQLVIVDESHLIPFDGDGMYQQFLTDLKRYNVHGCRIVGLTATPWRTVGGPICRPDAIFHKVAYDAPLQRLIEEGFLSRITNQPGDEAFDLSGVAIKQGDFVAGQMESVFSAGVERACREIVGKISGRRSILVFCAGVSHAEQVRTALELMLREPVGLVTGGSTALERASTLAAFRSGQLRALCNVDVLTTGFDHPAIDCVAVLRATMSPGLFCQMAGRGLRVAPGKTDCLLLDFGGNLERHGPLDAINFGKQSGGGAGGEAPVKVCPGCQEEVLISARQCPCGFVFPSSVADRHGDKADDQSKVLAVPETHIIDTVKWALHTKKQKPDEPAKPPTLRIDYWPKGNLARERPISEWVCLEHEGFARRKAETWWREHSLEPIPDRVLDAVAILDQGGARFAKTLVVKKEDGFDRIISREMPDFPEPLGDAYEPPSVSGPPDEWATVPTMPEAELPF